MTHELYYLANLINTNNFNDAHLFIYDKSIFIKSKYLNYNYFGETILNMCIRKYYTEKLDTLSKDLLFDIIYAIINHPQHNINLYNKFPLENKPPLYIIIDYCKNDLEILSLILSHSLLNVNYKINYCAYNSISILHYIILIDTDNSLLDAYKLLLQHNNIKKNMIDDTIKITAFNLAKFHNKRDFIYT